MMQAPNKTLLLLAILALTSFSGRLFADAPEKILSGSTGQSATDQGIQDRLQQVGHQNASQIQQAQCTAQKPHAQCNSCERSQSIVCDTCEKKGFWNWVKSKFHSNDCDFNMNCHQCRRIGRRCGSCRSRSWGPTGCGGKGCPPIGMYQMVYPLNPQHCDPRDRNVHAAQGYGVPMSVPLAPVVRHQYNYSWGVPASRLTPISNYAPRGAYGYGTP